MTDDKFFGNELTLYPLWTQKCLSMSSNLLHLTGVFSLNLLQKAMNTERKKPTYELIQ